MRDAGRSGQEANDVQGVIAILKHHIYHHIYLYSSSSTPVKSGTLGDQFSFDHSMLHDNVRIKTMAMTITAGCNNSDQR
jgi:hypothetical protein